MVSDLGHAIEVIIGESGGQVILVGGGEHTTNGIIGEAADRAPIHIHRSQAFAGNVGVGDGLDGGTCGPNRMSCCAF